MPDVRRLLPVAAAMMPGLGTCPGSTEALQPRTGHSAQGGLVDTTGQRSRWYPAPSLSDEAVGGIDDSSSLENLGAQRRQRQLCTRPLLAIERALVKVSLVVKGDKAEGDPDHPNRLAVQELHDDVGHAHSGSSKSGPPMACRIPQHLVELGVRQAIQAIVLVEQKPTTRHPHHVTPPNKASRPRQQPPQSSAWHGQPAVSRGSENIDAADHCGTSPAGIGAQAPLR